MQTTWDWNESLPSSRAEVEPVPEGALELVVKLDLEVLLASDKDATQLIPETLPSSLKHLTLRLDLANLEDYDEPQADDEECEDYQRRAREKAKRLKRPLDPASNLAVALLAKLPSLVSLDLDFELKLEDLQNAPELRALRKLKYTLVYSDNTVEPLLTKAPGLLELALSCNPFDFEPTTQTFSPGREISCLRLNTVFWGPEATRRGVAWLAGLVGACPRLLDLILTTQFHGLSRCELVPTLLDPVLEALPATLEKLQTNYVDEAGIGAWPSMETTLRRLSRLERMVVAPVPAPCFQYDTVLALATILSESVRDKAVLEVYTSHDCARALAERFRGTSVGPKRVEASTEGASDFVLRLELLTGSGE